MKKRWRPGREALLLLYFPVYLALFFLAEHVVREEYWVSYCTLDALIPFVPQFVYFYLMWFPLMFGVTFWLLRKDARAFLRYGWTFIISTLLGFAIFFLLPNGQELRPATVEGSGLSAFLMRVIYAVDSNTNVLPSMHVLCTLVAMAGALDTDTLSRGRKLGIAVLGVLVTLSTMFTKQHSALDVLCAIALFFPVWLLVYHPPKPGSGKEE